MVMTMRKRKSSKKMTLTMSTSSPMEMTSRLLRKKKRMEQTIVAVTIIKISMLRLIID